MKAMAIEGLARVGDPSQIVAIDASLKGEHDDRVLLAGTFATVLLAGGSIERITDALLRPKQRDQAKQYLADISRRSANVLGRYAQDPDPGVRADIADVLGSPATRPRCRSSSR